MANGLGSLAYSNRAFLPRISKIASRPLASLMSPLVSGKPLSQLLGEKGFWRGRRYVLYMTGQPPPHPTPRQIPLLTKNAWCCHTSVILIQGQESGSGKNMCGGRSKKKKKLKQQQQKNNKPKQTHNKPEAPCLWIAPFSSYPTGERSP